MNTIFHVLLLLFFDSLSLYGIIIRGLFIAGSWMILKKSGIRPFWALVPWVREYQLSRCSMREPEGRWFMISSIIVTVLQITLYFFRNAPDESFVFSLAALILVIIITAMIVHFVFNIRVFSGLIEIYGLKKLWILLFIIDDTRFIPLLIWGFGSKYQPEWKVEDLRGEMKRLATQGSAPVIGDGLTVNLENRTVREFFHTKMLLRDIHMAIPQGHMVLLLGGSGAGKTTYVNAVNGYEKANAQVTLNGQNMYKDYKKMQYEVGFVPQSEMIRSKDTVFNTLMDSASLRLSIDIPADERRARVEDVIDTFGLRSVRNSKVEKLSGGQKKRLSISMEYLSNPSLFILDEPDSGLDAVMAGELFEHLRAIADSGKIIIVITHSPDRVIDLFDDIIVLAKDSTRTGRLAYFGSIDGARAFFGCDKMEDIIKLINHTDEGGEGRADEFVLKYAEVANG